MNELPISITEYKAAVIERLKSGEATNAEWEEVANCVLSASEGFGVTTALDCAIYGSCIHCGKPLTLHCHRFCGDSAKSEEFGL